jgi:hypothetical protein
MKKRPRKDGTNVHLYFSLIAPVDLLTEAKKLISDEKHWCKGALMRLRGVGRNTIRAKDIRDAATKSGKQWCAIGALAFTAKRIKAELPGQENQYSFYIVERDAIGSLYNAIPGRRWFTVEEFNDAKTTKHKDILRLYDRAISSFSTPSPTTPRKRKEKGHRAK